MANLERSFTFEMLTVSSGYVSRMINESNIKHMQRPLFSLGFLCAMMLLEKSKFICTDAYLIS